MSQRMVITGASGLIGRALSDALRSRGTIVHTLVRNKPEDADEHFWDPDKGQLDPSLLAGADALISLNGASVSRLPWTRRYRELLRSSRINSTRTLADAIRSLGQDAPKAWLSSSASGYYGSRPGETLTEASSPGDTFLARLCVAWEEEALAAADCTRVVLLRTAPVLHRHAVLKPMIPLTRFGLAGPLGGGRQHWPWISLEDEVHGILHAFDHGLKGPVNLTGPTPATANDVGRELAHQMRRPFLVPAPRFALNAALGADAAESLLTADADVRPQALEQSGYVFRQPTAAAAIHKALQ